MTARIKSARVAAAHEGDAELIVSLVFENGGCSEVALDHTAVEALMTACNANSLEELVGYSWEKVRDALQFSGNRYM